MKTGVSIGPNGHVCTTSGNKSKGVKVLKTKPVKATKKRKK